MAENSDLTTRGSLPESKNDNNDRTQATESIQMYEDDSSEPDWTSDASFSADSDSEDCPLDARLQRPTKYFQELDNLESKVLENSMFQFYTDGTTHKPFDSHIHMKVGYGGSTSLQGLKAGDVRVFYEQVLAEANEAQMASPSAMEHYHAKNSLDRAIENLYHFIECRNIILWVLKSVEAMEVASYCRGVISILIIDETDHDVARLLPIQSRKIRQLATAFESCLSRLIGLHPSTALVDTETTFAKEVSEVCQDLLSELGLYVPTWHCTEVWRSTVHILDVAVLSYAGAHTQVFGMSAFKCITLPGPFLKTQYFVFRRRSFLCIGEFLGGQEAWVLERYHPEAPDSRLPSLYLSTDAMTFGDIWGPMWKTCALRKGQADPDHILRYSVGNGVILPGNPSSNSKYSISGRKNEVLCHWISDKQVRETGNLVQSSGEPLHPNDILLIGASVKLNYNLDCKISPNESRQYLKDAGVLSELGTMSNAWFVESEAVQIQLGPPYVKVGSQRTYKRRGRTWKEAVIENWKTSPETRNVRILEYRFGVEVSTCTHNARRRRLITLLGSDTMMNYLRNGSLIWNSTECQEKFYAALESSDYKAFRNLYKSHKDWQSDLGKAISHCLDALAETGTNKKGLDLLWVPNSEPGQRVNVSFREHSWVGFLKDTEDCCTMAVLEDKCLELSNVTQARKCRNRNPGSAPTIGSRPDQILDTSVLETSFMLNQNSVPRTMRQIRCHGHNGSEPRHSHRWSTSLLEPRERFNFGENGQLKLIRSLGNSQILVNWKSSWEPLEALRERLQGNYNENRHREYIRDEKGEAGPINVLVMSSERDRTTSSLDTLGTSQTPRLGSNVPHVRRYAWVPSTDARPRSFAETRRDELQQIMSRWRSDELTSLDNPEWEAFRETIAHMVAALPSPAGNSRGAVERDTRQE